MNYPNQTIIVIQNWLADKSAFVKAGEVSRTFNVPYGCVQGSMAGLTLFSILLSQLVHFYLDMIRYADNAYFFFEVDDWEQIKCDTEKTMPKLVDWLKVRNASNAIKTKACLFEPKKSQPKIANVMGEATVGHRIPNRWRYSD
jgi:hypothetical protein